MESYLSLYVGKVIVNLEFRKLQVCWELLASTFFGGSSVQLFIC